MLQPNDVPPWPAISGIWALTVGLGVGLGLELASNGVTMKVLVGWLGIIIGIIAGSVGIFIIRHRPRERGR